LALAHPLHARGADQLVHRAGRDALDRGFLDHRRQRLLGGFPGLQEGGEVGAAPKLRDPQLDRADAGLPVSVAVAVALHQAVGTALAMGGAGHLAHLQLHQALGGKADHLAQEGRAGPASAEGPSSRRSSWSVQGQGRRPRQPNPTEDHQAGRPGRSAPLSHAASLPAAAYAAPTPSYATRRAVTPHTHDQGHFAGVSIGRSPPGALSPASAAPALRLVERVATPPTAAPKIQALGAEGRHRLIRWPVSRADERRVGQVLGATSRPRLRQAEEWRTRRQTAMP
jgi:hypothetical protein